MRRPSSNRPKSHGGLAARPSLTLRAVKRGPYAIAAVGRPSGADWGSASLEVAAAGVAGVGVGGVLAEVQVAALPAAPHHHPGQPAEGDARDRAVPVVVGEGDRGAGLGDLFAQRVLRVVGGPEDEEPRGPAQARPQNPGGERRDDEPLHPRGLPEEQDQRAERHDHRPAGPEDRRPHPRLRVAGGAVAAVDGQQFLAGPHRLQQVDAVGRRAGGDELLRRPASPWRRRGSWRPRRSAAGGPGGRPRRRSRGGSSLRRGSRRPARRRTDGRRGRAGRSRCSSCRD